MIYTKISEIAAENESVVDTKHIITNIERLMCETYLNKGMEVNYLRISDDDATIGITRNEIPGLIEYLQTLYDVNNHVS